MKKEKEIITNNSRDLLDASFRPFAEWLCELAGIQCGEYVMDLGAGAGISTDVVLRKTLPNGKVVAVDPDVDVLKGLDNRIPKEYREKVRFITESAENLEVHFQNEKFDAVISNFSFHLFNDQSIALRQICNSLKSGGKLAFSVPGALHVKEFRQVLMTVLDELNLRKTFFTSGPLIPDKNMIDGWCRADENSWETWKKEEKKIFLNCSPDEYLDHMIRRGGAKRILRRLPIQSGQSLWEAVRSKMKDTYPENCMPMTLHALAVYSKKL